MKELMTQMEETIQKNGYQCIRIKDYYDFSQKLNCMGGEYKGFVMTEEPDRLCILYIDTIEMLKEAEKKSIEFSQIMETMSYENRIFLSNMPEEYIKKYNDYRTLGFYLRAKKEYDRFYEEKEMYENKSFFTKLKELFKK